MEDVKFQELGITSFFSATCIPVRRYLRNGCLSSNQWGSVDRTGLELGETQETTILMSKDIYHGIGQSTGRKRLSKT